MFIGSIWYKEGDAGHEKCQILSTSKSIGFIISCSIKIKLGLFSHFLTFSRFPENKLSKHITFSPEHISLSMIWDPKKPAPPATKFFKIIFLL